MHTVTFTKRRSLTRTSPSGSLRRRSAANPNVSSISACKRQRVLLRKRTERKLFKGAKHYRESRLERRLILKVNNNRKPDLNVIPLVAYLVSLTLAQLQDFISQEVSRQSTSAFRKLAYTSFFFFSSASLPSASLV